MWIKAGLQNIIIPITEHWVKLAHSHYGHVYKRNFYQSTFLFIWFMCIQNFTYISLNCSGSSAGAQKERVGSAKYFVSTLCKCSLERSHLGQETICCLHLQGKKNSLRWKQRQHIPRKRSYPPTKLDCVILRLLNSCIFLNVHLPTVTSCIHCTVRDAGTWSVLDRTLNQMFLYADAYNNDITNTELWPFSIWSYTFICWVSTGRI
jgi:hypothetical protein